MTQRPIITLTTDFGSSDPYVASMKGVILEIAPDTSIVDITHHVPPQDVTSASFALLASYRYFPRHSIHVVVVDPGVGTARRSVGVIAAWGTYVGPDNGCLGAALANQGCLDAETGVLQGATARELSNRQYQNPVVSTTFHGRDIFAPAAAHLARAVPLDRFGRALDSLTVLPGTIVQEDGGVVRGRIVHIDHFGNAVSNISEEFVPPRAVVETGGIVIAGLSKTYQDGDIVALIGSTGRVEVARRNGNAALSLGLKKGDDVLVRPLE